MRVNPRDGLDVGVFRFERLVKSCCSSLRIDGLAAHVRVFIADFD